MLRVKIKLPQLTILDAERRVLRVGHVVDTVLARNPNARICISAIALETLSAAVAALTAHGLAAEVTQIAVSRTRPAGRLHLLMANNPIFLITGERK